MTTQTEAGRLAGELERVAIRSDSSYWDSLVSAAAEMRRLVSFNNDLMDEVARLQKREWAGLTDAEAFRILSDEATDWMEKWNAIEAKLKEKNT